MPVPDFTSASFGPLEKQQQQFPIVGRVLILNPRRLLFPFSCSEMRNVMFPTSLLLTFVVAIGLRHKLYEMICLIVTRLYLISSDLQCAVEIVVFVC